jgi:hypothetical protein
MTMLKRSLYFKDMPGRTGKVSDAIRSLIGCKAPWSRMIVCTLICLTSCACQGPLKNTDPLGKTLTLVSVDRIWDGAPHNAFTGLAWFRGHWYCAFREADHHGVSPSGAIRVIQSRDGDTWRSVIRFHWPEGDLRDAKLTVTPDNQLMLNGVIAFNDHAQGTHQSLVWLSPDGIHWSDGHPIGDRNIWLWSTTWHRTQCYGVGYSTGDDRFVRLYHSDDGIDFQNLADQFKPEGNPSEATLRFTDDNTAVCLLREDPGFGFVGTAKPPYTQWQWQSLGQRIGGPNMIQLPDGRWIAAVRLYDTSTRTSLCWLNPQTGAFSECLALPSGGDTSYAGMVYRNGLLWVSYYSSHEGQTNIYLARVKL